MATRRQFLLASAAAALTASPQAPAKTRVGLVHSTHPGLIKPVSPEHPLDSELVRDMVWKAIRYGRPTAGSLEAKIKPGSWVVLKPNYCYLSSQPGYRTGDVTDMRVLRAVLEYVSQYSKARRITIAEGGSFRNIRDPLDDNVVKQNGSRTDLTNYDWGADDFPGWGGSIGGMLRDAAARHPDKTFDFIDLAYDVVKDAAGGYLALPVPKLNGVGSFSRKTEYFVTNTVRNCDFLISLPVLKVHENCGMTCCFKNYVGTGPRVAYTRLRAFTNLGLHNDHAVDTRIDPFIGDLAAFHPPDYNVVDVIRGLQYTEHNNRQPNQMIRTNLIMAGENPVSLDAIAATMIGYRPGDIDYLRMAEARGLGSYDLNKVEIAGDDADKFFQKWSKPRTWYSRSNREWRVTGDPALEAGNWKRFTSFGDMLDLMAAAGDAPSYAALATVKSDGARKGFLWVDLTGTGTVEMNGQKIMQEEGATRFRVGQFQQPVELRNGENQFVFRVQPSGGKAALAALLVGSANSGDSLEGVTWTA